MEKVDVKLKKDLSLLLESLLNVQANLSRHTGSIGDRAFISSIICDWQLENHPDISSSVLDALDTFNSSTNTYEGNRKSLYKRLLNL